MKQSGASIKAAILTMSVVQMGTSAIAPIMADIQGAFPAAGASTVQFLMTFPSLAVIIVSLAGAGLAARVPKKYLAALGCALFALSGILSWAVHGSLAMLFVWAGIMGLGIGLVVPMATSLVSDCFTGAERQAVMGWQSSAANIGAMLMTFFGGLAAQIHWSCNYLVYLVALPGIFFCLAGLPRTTAAPAAAGGSSGGALKALLCSGAVLLNCAVSAIITMLFNLVPTNLSMYVAERGLGSSVEAGTGTSLLLLGGTCGGLLFGKVSGRLGHRVMALGFGMLTAGLLLCVSAPNIWFVYIGCLLGGSCISLVVPQLLLNGAACAGENTGMFSALIMAASNLGSFLTPVLTVLVKLATGSELVSPRLTCGAALAFIMTALLWLVLSGKVKGKAAEYL